MAIGQKGDLIISGHGKSGGGSFERVIINGHGVIHGDITARVVVINGISKMHASVYAEEMEINGHSKNEGRVTFRKMEINGKASFLNSIEGKELQLNGMVKIEGDCEVENAELNGGFTIEGLLNADTIAISLSGRSTVKEIGGETISVKRDKQSFLQLDKLFSILNKELTADMIEGDVIELENTIAKTVRGKHVHIGPGCQIDLVEYREDIRISEEADVKKSVKI
ncbi:polymer-forming cytoskeletal protein [Bacillaceae bacterium CLA-AA-H227]|nr:polymer-forming cytoskeletal protein [Bacillus yapensis]